MDEYLKAAYDQIANKYGKENILDFDSFKESMVKDPEYRKSYYDIEVLPFYNQDPENTISFNGFEAQVFGNTPKEVEKSSKDIKWYEDLLNFIASGNPLNAMNPADPNQQRAIREVTQTFVGAEFLASDPLYQPRTLALQNIRQNIDNPFYIGLEEPGMPPSKNPFYSEDEKVRESRKKDVEDTLHKEYTEMSNRVYDIEEKYVKAGLIDREEDTFLKQQFFSLGMNLPFVVAGGAAAKLGWTGVSSAVQFLGYPLFTFSEANAFAGEVYKDTAELDSSGRVIEGTGDLDKTAIAQPFGIIAGLFEFWGPHTAIGMFKQGGKTLAEELTAKQMFKNMAKVGFIEGVEEGVYQGPIEQLTKMGLNLQDKFSFKQSLDEFLGGAFGGAILGGSSMIANTSELYKLQNFAKNDAPKQIDNAEKTGLISKEKADNYRKTAEVLSNTPIEELKPAVDNLNAAMKDLRETSFEKVKSLEVGYDIYDRIFNSDIEDPMLRYEYAIPDKTTRKEFLDKVEGSKEFQDLQKQLKKENPNLTPEALLPLTHKRMQTERAVDDQSQAKLQAIQNKVTEIEDERKRELVSNNLTRKTPASAEELVGKFTEGENVQPIVKETGEKLKKLLPERVGNYVLSDDGTFVVQGNWRIGYDEEVERTNINTNKKFIERSTTHINIDQEDIIGKSDEEILKKIDEQLRRAGIISNNEIRIAKNKKASEINTKYETELKKLVEDINQEAKSPVLQSIDSEIDRVTPLPNLTAAQTKLMQLSLSYGKTLAMLDMLSDGKIPSPTENETILFERSPFKTKNVFASTWAAWKFKKKVERYNREHNTKFTTTRAFMPGDQAGVQVIVHNSEKDAGTQQNIHFEKSMINLDKVLEQSPVIKEVVTKIGSDPQIALSGSLGLSVKGSIFRDTIHDLDFRTTMSEDILDNYLHAQFQNVVKHKNFKTKLGHVVQYIVFPEDIENYKRYDKEGKLVEIKGMEPGRVVVVDFFLQGDIGEVFQHSIDKEGQSPINVVDPMDTFSAKVGLARDKDYEDLENFNLYEKPAAPEESKVESKTPRLSLKGSKIIPFRNPKAFEVTSKFDEWLSKQNGRIDLSKPFKAGLSEYGQYIVEAFRLDYLAKNKFLSVPKERLADFKKDWNAWLKENIGLRHKEGIYENSYIGEMTYSANNMSYGLGNITLHDIPIKIIGSEVIISGDFLLSDLSHKYVIENERQYSPDGNIIPESNETVSPLAWYIFIQINDETFIYEWQSDILPDLFSTDAIFRTITHADGSTVTEYGDNKLVAITYAKTGETKYLAFPKKTLPSTALTPTAMKHAIEDELKIIDVRERDNKFGFIYNYPWVITNGNNINLSLYKTEEEAKAALEIYKSIEVIDKDEFSKRVDESRRELIGTELKRFVENSNNSINTWIAQAANTLVEKRANAANQVVDNWREAVTSVYNELLDKFGVQEAIADNKSSLIVLENLYKKYWQTFLMHSFMYAKEKGKTEIWLPTGKAMKKIEHSRRTAAMYATKWDLTEGDAEAQYKEWYDRLVTFVPKETSGLYTDRWKVDIGFMDLIFDTEAQVRDYYKRNGENDSETFDKVGPYWTALSKIKGIKLELSQPKWSNIPLIKADISGVNTEALVLFTKTPKTQLYNEEKLLQQMSFRGKPITMQKIGQGVALRNEADKILMDLELLKQKYNDKAWTKPMVAGVTPLTVDEFNSFNEFLTFALVHEVTHDTVKKKKNETKGDYENRINQEALKDYREKYYIPQKTTGRGAPATQRVNPTQTTDKVSEKSLGELTKQMKEAGKQTESSKEMSDFIFSKLDQNMPIVLTDKDYLLGKDGNGQNVYLGKEIAAFVSGTKNSPARIVLNKEKLNTGIGSIWDSILHEGTHAFIFASLQKDNKLFDEGLYNKISALMREVKLRMETDYSGFYQANRDDLERIFEVPFEEGIQEFVAYLIGGNSKLSDWARSTTVSNNSKSTYLGRFIDILRKWFAKIGPQDPTFMDALETMLSKTFGSPAKADYWNNVMDDTSGIYDSMEQTFEQFDKIQDPDNTIDNPRIIRSIGKQLADELGETPTDYISYVKAMTFEQFRKRLLNLSGWKKSVSLFYSTQNYDFTVGELMEKLITQIYEYAASLEKLPTVRLVTRYDTEIDHVTTTIEELGDSYRDKDGAFKSGWRNKIKLNERLGTLKGILGTEFELVYLDDEKYIKGNNTTYNSINNINFDLPNRNETYVNAFAKHGIIFPGTWSDKGTVIGLRIKNGDPATALRDIGKIYDDKIVKLKEAGIEFNSFEDNVSPAVERARTMRLLIEDLRLGGVMTDAGFQSSLFNLDDPSSYDLIKILKRPTEVAPMTATIQNPDRITEALKGSPIGIVKQGNGLAARTIIMNAFPEPGQWIEKFNFKGREVTVDMYDCFVNDLGTATTDGVVYYLDEGFGKVYRYLHGVINPGAIKAWIGNSVSGDFTSPLFIKASFQKKSTENLLGAWMKANNVTLLVSSESSKVNKGQKVSNLYDPDTVNIFNIPFDNIYRDKEKGVVKKSVRGAVQSLSANLDTKENPFLVGDPSPYYTELLESLTEEFVDTIEDMDSGQLLQELKEVALNGTSQYERSLAQLVLDMAYTQADEAVKQSESVFFMDPKEDKIKRDVYNIRIAKELGGLFHEPYFAEILKSKISKALHKVVNHKANSTWAVFRPDIGWAEITNIEAIWKAILGTRSSETKEMQERLWEELEKYIDIKSGRLKENVSYISEDITKAHNIATLDDAVITVVPSDGMTAQQAVTVIPISLDTTDAGTIVANSEHTQTRVGKDFDIDTGRVSSFNSKYTSRTKYDLWIKTIRDTQVQHKKLTLQYYRNVLKDQSLTEKEIYSKEIQLKFMQILSDSPEVSNREYWNKNGIFTLLDMFAKDIGGVINDRKNITIKSQTGFVSSFIFNDKVYNFTTNHPNLPLYYLIAMRLTNDMVDKPTNENALHYEFPPTKLAEYQYNLELEDTPEDGMALAGMQAVDRFLFKYATRFTAGYNLTDKNQDRGLANDLTYVLTQQEIWRLLNGSRRDKMALADMYSDWYTTMYPNQKVSTANAFIKMGREYIVNSTVSNPAGSPLINAINSIPLEKIPNIGTSEAIYRVWQYRISEEINKKHSELVARVAQQWAKALAEFRSPLNKQYVNNFLLTSENPLLHLAKAVAIDFILPVDQRLRKENNAFEGQFHTDIFNRANEIVYPKLMQLLLLNKTFVFNKEMEATFSFKLGEDSRRIKLSRAPYNGLAIDYYKPGEEAVHWDSGYQLMYSNTTDAKMVRNLLMSNKGVFSSYENRWKLSQLVSFGRNIPMQGRIEFVKEFLDKVLPKFSEADKELFWHSLLGYPDPTDSYGVGDKPTKYTDSTLQDKPGSIRTPMNLVPYSYTQNPDQKTLLQVAEIVEDSSGRKFLREYMKAATLSYPGLTVDQTMRIESDINNGGLSTPAQIMFTRELREDYNDEAKTWIDGFLNIFDIAEKSKTEVPDDQLGVYPRLFSGRIGYLTPLDVTQSFSNTTTRKAWKINDEMVALKKAEMLLSSIKVFDSHLNNSYTRIEKAIQDLRGITKEPKAPIIKKINLLSEKFFGVDFSFDVNSGKMSYIASNGVGYSDKEIDKMLLDYGIPREEFGYYKAALELRKIYDYWNPKMIEGTIAYLTHLRTTLPEGFINTPIINSYLRKWIDLQQRFAGMKGRYFPRMFKEEVYDTMAEDWALWNVVSELFPNEAPEKFRELKASGAMSEEVRRRVEREIHTLTVDKHGDYVYPWQRERVVPEWLAKDKYIVDTMDMHSKHMLQFQNAIVNDISVAEWLLYEHNASLRGQDPKIMTRMLTWYGNMTTDRYLKSEKVEIEKLKPEDQISFYYRRNNKERYIRGEVDRIEGGSIFLKVDPDIVSRQIQQTIVRYGKTHDDIVSNPNIRPDREATDRQMQVIESLVEEGYLREGRSYTILDANDAIIEGLTEMLDDQANWGKFRTDRIYVKQYQGTRGVLANGKVERSLLSGKGFTIAGKEFNSSDLWQGTQLFSANMFLGNPGAAVKNWYQAKYRIVQDFGWLRYFNVPGFYYKLLDTLPDDLRNKFPFSSKVPNRINEVYSGIKERSKIFVNDFLTKANEGDLSDFYQTLYPIITNQRSVANLTDTEKLKVVGAFAGKYIVENGLAGAADIGNAFVKEVGSSPTKETWDKAKSALLQWFLKAEGKVRREAAFLYAYKAIFYDGLTDPKEINKVIEKGVAVANSLYDMMYRKLGEGNPAGKVLFQFSQFNTFQGSMYKSAAKQARELGQIKEVNNLDDLLFNFKSFFSRELTVDLPDGTTKTYKIGDSVDPLLTARMAKYFWQDTISMVMGFAFPGFNASNPVHKTMAAFLAMIINMISTGELPDEWDLSDWIFGLLAFRLGLGFAFPMQIAYNVAAGKNNIVSMPKMTTAVWETASDLFSADGRKRQSEEYYTLGKVSRLLLSVDATPHSRKYYSDAQNELTKTAVKKLYKPFVGEVDLGPLTIPVPSENLIPVYNLSRFSR